jgi:hypothetical protein
VVEYGGLLESELRFPSTTRVDDDAVEGGPGECLSVVSFLREKKRAAAGVSYAIG